MNQRIDTENGTRPTRPWCLFQSGQSSYAIGLESVAEIVEFDRLVRLPQSPPRLAGLCVLRRDVLPIVGLETTPPAETEEHRDRHLVLILKTSQGSWGIEVAAEGTVVAEEPLEAAPGRSDDVQPWFTLLGLVHRGESTYSAIDPEGTWQQVRRGVESYYAGNWVDDTRARRD
ncbi:MAG: chemotaxis protein CheW [Isosphaeraceae bacterium]